MDLLSPKVKAYPWGTRDAIAELQGRPVPAPGPEAELWMGAHPSAPSALHRPPLTPALPTSSVTSVTSARSTTSAPPVTLDAVIAGDPERELGAECAARF